MSRAEIRTIGFIGLGRMGQPMAANLLRAGFGLRVADADPAAVDSFCAAESGAVACKSPTAATTGAQAVITMLPDGECVREVALAAKLQAGQLLIDMSSADPVGTRALGDTLAAQGVAMVDAPVSGGRLRALDATLAIMAGGLAENVERARPVLEKLGAQIFATGALGSGHAMKALNNYLGAAATLCSFEALLIGKAFGLDPALMTDVLNASTGRNNTTVNKLKQQILSGAFASGFSLELMAKDVGIAEALARNLGVGSPFLGETARLWRDAKEKLPAGSDHTEIYRYLESPA